MGILLIQLNRFQIQEVPEKILQGNIVFKKTVEYFIVQLRSHFLLPYLLSNLLQ